MGIDDLDLFNNLPPSATKIPVPRSCVALPPSPRKMFLQLDFKACFICKPVPYVEVKSGFFSSYFIWISPEA